MFSAGPGGSSSAAQMSSAAEQLNAMLGSGGHGGGGGGVKGSGHLEDLVSGVHEWRNIQVRLGVRLGVLWFLSLSHTARILLLYCCYTVVILLLYCCYLPASSRAQHATPHTQLGICRMHTVVYCCYAHLQHDPWRTW